MSSSKCPCCLGEVGLHKDMGAYLCQSLYCPDAGTYYFDEELTNPIMWSAPMKADYPWHAHEWVDVGFNHSRWVCKVCNIDKPSEAP